MSIDQNSVEEKTSVAQRLKNFIKQKKVTQASVAEALGIVPSAMTRAVKGEGYLSVESLLKLHTLYSINLHWLLIGEGEMMVNDNEHLHTPKQSEFRYEFTEPLSSKVAEPSSYGTLAYMSERDNEFSACQVALEAAKREIVMLENRLKDKDDIIDILKAQIKILNDLIPQQPS